MVACVIIAGTIISETAPDRLNRFTWLKPLPDGSIEYYEPDDGGWVKVKTVAAPIPADHSHSSLGDINLTGTISSGGTPGITGSKTLGGYIITFKNGLLTGFQQE